MGHTIVVQPCPHPFSLWFVLQCFHVCFLLTAIFNNTVLRLKKNASKPKPSDMSKISAEQRIKSLQNKISNFWKSLCEWWQGTTRVRQRSDPVHKHSLHTYIMKAYIEPQTNATNSPLAGLFPPPWESCSFFCYSLPLTSWDFLWGFYTFFTFCLTNFMIKSYHNCFLLEVASSSCGVAVVSPPCNPYSFPCPGPARFPYLQVPLVPQLLHCIILLPVPFVNVISISVTNCSHF